MHRELKLDFDPARTLIGGPNETGKSTLIEAIHRALFLKARGNTEYHRALSSTLHPGHPEVELAFEAGGNTYQLKKRFGANGTVTLGSAQTGSLAGDAAETELARILNVENGLSGKAIPNQWAHLWVWQGQAGDDPSEQAAAHVGGLLQRLQQIGGAAVLQSELDARVAERFAGRRNQIYTQAGKPKAGSVLESAETALASAGEQLALAQARVGTLESSVTDLEAASRELAAAAASLESLERQRDEMDARGRQLEPLQRQAIEQTQAARETENRHAALEATHRQILDARSRLAQLGETLQPLDAAVAQLEQARNQARLNADSAEQTYRAASEAVRAARLRQDLAAARVRFLEKSKALSLLVEKEQKASQRRVAQAELEELLAKLPKVDKARLGKLQKLEAACSNADATLQAMATGLEVVAADQAVKVGPHLLPEGQRQILTEDAEVTIGATVRLRIQPGGGTSLAEARQNQAEARRALQEQLDSVTLKSVAEAGEIFTQREELNSRIKVVRAELATSGAEHLADDLQNARNELAAANADMERLAALAPEETVPADKAAAKAAEKAAARKLTAVEEAETEGKANRDRAVQSLTSAEAAFKTKTIETQGQRNSLTRLQAEVDLLLRTHGDDTDRARALLEAEAAKRAAAGRLQETAHAIASLQPDLLEGDRARITRAIHQKTQERDDAKTRIAVARAALRSDGSEDPRAALATAEARARSAREHHQAVHTQAQAVALLDQLFQQEQRALSEQFTRPLAERISGYLECLFGPGACAQVDLDNNQFSGLRLSRPGFGGIPFAFDTLSGGAREQTAAAVRLAMAELLAADHGACLPVVFDDAFAYSDPDRVNTLQLMLDLAAARGLQIIVLTCNPADYAALGAKTVMLRPG